MTRKELDERKKLVYDLMGEEMYVPMKEKELAILLQVSKSEREDFRQVLDELLSEGKITITKRGKYMRPEENEQVIVGTFVSHPKGFGFVEVEGMDEDLYIPETKVNGAFHKDTVQVVLLPGQRGKRQEAEIVKIIARGTKQVVGTFDKSKKNYGFVGKQQ